MSNLALIIPGPSQNYLKKLITTLPIEPKRKSLTLVKEEFSSPEAYERACEESSALVGFNEVLGDFVPLVRQPFGDFLKKTDPSVIEFQFCRTEQFEKIRKEYLEKLFLTPYRIAEINFQLINSKRPTYKTQITLSPRAGLELRLSEFDEDANRFRIWLDELKEYS